MLRTLRVVAVVVVTAAALVSPFSAASTVEA
jgi:hypothetical protein